MGIIAKPLCHQQPVDIGTEAQAQRCPHRTAQTGPVRDSRQAHQKPSAHVGSLSSHGRHPRSKGSAPNQVIVTALIGAPGIIQANANHHTNVQNHRNQNLQLPCLHTFSPLEILRFLPFLHKDILLFILMYQYANVQLFLHF